jgi:hypothetical protein
MSVASGRAAAKPSPRSSRGEGRVRGRGSALDRSRELPWPLTPTLSP